MTTLRYQQQNLHCYRNYSFVSSQQRLSNQLMLSHSLNNFTVPSILMYQTTSNFLSMLTVCILNNANGIFLLSTASIALTTIMAIEPFIQFVGLLMHFKILKTRQRSRKRKRNLAEQTRLVFPCKALLRPRQSALDARPLASQVWRVIMIAILISVVQIRFNFEKLYYLQPIQ